MISRIFLDVGGGGQSLSLPHPVPASLISIVGNKANVTDMTMLDMADAEVGYARQILPLRIHALGSTSQEVFGSAGASGATVGGSTIRVARVADPDDAAKFAWRLRCAKADSDTASAGAKRGEICYSPVLRFGAEHTCGFQFRLPSYAGHTDQFLFAQFHANNASALVMPWLAFYMIANRINVVARFNEATVATAALDNVSDTWRSAVVFCRKSDGVDGRLHVTIDGQVVIDYVGPLAESNNGLPSYWKSGVYEWNAATQWDDAFPVREVYVKGLYIADGDVRDRMNAFLTEI
mgnify:CR=1 FL=1